MAVVAVGSIATVAWNTHGWVASPTALHRLATTPPPERYLDTSLGSAVRHDTGLARERELHAGDIVVFERIAYLALLWNDHYTNRVVWLQDDPDPIRRAEQLGATWIYAGRGGWLDTHAGMPNSGWQRIDIFEFEGFGVVFRRKHRIP